MELKEFFFQTYALIKQAAFIIHLQNNQRALKIRILRVVGMYSVLSLRSGPTA